VPFRPVGSHNQRASDPQPKRWHTMKAATKQQNVAFAMKGIARRFSLGNCEALATAAQGGKVNRLRPNAAAQGEHGPAHLRLYVKQKAPARSFDRTEANWGLGVRHSLFPTLTLGAPLRGCQLPDAILHGKRNFRPHSRAVQHLAVTELLSEASWLAWAGVCSAGLRTRSRHVCDSDSAS